MFFGIRTLSFLLIAIMLNLSFCGDALAARGNFSKTCTDIRLFDDNVTLNASCERANNKGFRRTSLDIGGMIINKNGRLLWQGGGHYERTCKNVYLDVPGDVELIADCANYDGNYIHSSINLDDVIENIDGALMRPAGSVPSQPPLKKKKK